MDLPSGFISTITDTFGAEGEDLIANLPALIEEASPWDGIEDNTGWDYAMQCAELFTSLG